MYFRNAELNLSLFLNLKKVRVRSATTKELECAHVCVRTYIWTCEVRACDAKNRRNPHLDTYHRYQK